MCVVVADGAYEVGAYRSVDDDESKQTRIEAYKFILPSRVIITGVQDHPFLKSRT